MTITLAKEKQFVVLASVWDIGGEGTKKEVLDNIEAKEYLAFDTVDLTLKHNRNELRWRNDLAYVRKWLVNHGYIDDFEWNVWSISEDGIHYLKELSFHISASCSNEFQKLTNHSIRLAQRFLSTQKNQEIQTWQPSNPIKEIEQYRPSYSYLPEIERESVVQSRIGQGQFRLELIKYWKGCAVTGCKAITVLKASHIKPWRDADNAERLDVFNGLLLVPNLDTAFDNGLISFRSDGKILISNLLDYDDKRRLSIDSKMGITKLKEQHLKYIKYHRENIFKQT